MKTLRICLWSGPRNVSTALLYAFAQRGDTRVIDEPLYAHYLRLTGADHPGRDEVLTSMDSDGERVVREVVLGPCDRPVLFMKQMAHHLIELDHSFFRRTVNVLLIRDPVEMLPSLAKHIPTPSLLDSGLKMQVELLNELHDIGQDPPVLDARNLLLDPHGILTSLCNRLDIAFAESMLSWPVGGRPEDGVWGKFWYQNLHRSTGFSPYRPKREPFPEPLRPLLEQCLPFYETLKAQAI